MNEGGKPEFFRINTTPGFTSQVRYYVAKLDRINTGCGVVSVLKTEFQGGTENDQSHTMYQCCHPEKSG